MSQNLGKESWTLEQLKEGYEGMAAINLALCRDFFDVEEEAEKKVENALR